MSLTLADFSDIEIIEAKQALNTYPDASPFWDSRAGQEVLQCAAACGLRPDNSNADRIAINREAVRESVHHCRVCDEPCIDGNDCCYDDFPEPGDIRETGR